MRKYADIITDLKGGKTVEYEEARLAAIMVEGKDREGLDNFLKHMTEYVDLCMA